MKMPKSAARPTKRYFFMVVGGEIPYQLLTAVTYRTDHEFDHHEGQEHADDELHVRTQGTEQGGRLG